VKPTRNRRPAGLAVALAAMLGVLLLVAPASRATAQGSVRSEVDARKIGMLDQVQLTLTVDGPSLPDQVPLPALGNLRVVGGPSVSTQMSFVNGQSSQSRSWTWALQPIAVGQAEIGAVRVALGSTQATAPAIAIEVVQGSIAPAQPPQRSFDPFEDIFGRRPQRHEVKLFIEAKASRTSLYVGEPLLVTYYLYTQASISGLQFDEVPQFNGFWAEDPGQPQRNAGEPATVEGVPYRRFPILVKLLYPTRSGRITIPRATLRIQVSPQSFFDAGGVVSRATQPMTIDVKPIPEEPGFSGAVGRFKTRASMDRTDLAFGDAATLRFEIEGSGNLKWVDRGPELTLGGAKVYPPQVKSDLRTGPSGISGSRTWEYVVVPQTMGNFEIPALAFSYFDPTAGHIVRTTTAPIPVHVTGGAPGAVPAPVASMPGMASRGGPLRLRTEIGPPASRVAIPGLAVAVLALVALLLHGLLWGGQRLAALRAHAPSGRAPRGARGALRDLDRVGRETMSKESAAIVIEKTLFAVFGSLDGDESERGRAVRTLLDDLHAVRYAPQLGDYSERLRALAVRAGDVVRRWA